MARPPCRPCGTRPGAIPPSLDPTGSLGAHPPRGRSSAPSGTCGQTAVPGPRDCPRPPVRVVGTFPRRPHDRPRPDPRQGPQAAGPGRGPGGDRARSRHLHRQGSPAHRRLRHRPGPPRAGRPRLRPGGRPRADPRRALRRRQGRPALDRRQPASLPRGAADPLARRAQGALAAPVRPPLRPRAHRAALHQPAPPGGHRPVPDPRPGRRAQGRLPPVLARRLPDGDRRPPRRGRAARPGGVLGQVPRVRDLHGAGPRRPVRPRRGRPPRRLPAARHRSPPAALGLGRGRGLGGRPPRRPRRAPRRWRPALAARHG